MNGWRESDHPRERDTKRFRDKDSMLPHGPGDLEREETDDGFGDIFTTPVDPDSVGSMGIEQEAALMDAVAKGRTLDEYMMARRRIYVEKVLADMLDTQSTYSTVTEEGRREYTPERRRQQQRILDHILARAADVPARHRALMTGGIGGAGKSSSLKAMGVRSSDWLTLNNDDIKEEMAAAGMIPKVRGLTPMEASTLVHEEASDMLRKLREKAYERGLNVILDGTMASYGSTKRKIDQLHEAGYDVHAMFVDVSVDTAKRRALTRYRHALDEYTTSRARLGYGGRWLPTAVLDGQHGDDARYRTVNAATFSRLASEGVFDAEPAVFDNDVDGRRSRRLPLDGFVDGLR